MRQWMLRITAYAERLLQDLDTIDWTDSLKEMQRNWIGRSEGAEVDFQIASRIAERGYKNPRFHDAAGHVVRRDLHGAFAGTQARGRKSPRRNSARRLRNTKPTSPRNPIWNARNWPRKKPASSPALTPSIPSTARKFRSGLPITSWPAMAPARSWPCPRTTRAILNSPEIQSSHRSSRRNRRIGKTDWQGFIGDGICGKFHRQGNFH